MIALVRDISKRKRAEQELHSAHERMKSDLSPAWLVTPKTKAQKNREWEANCQTFPIELNTVELPPVLGMLLVPG